MLENIGNVVFTRPKSRRAPELVCSAQLSEEAIDSYKNAPDDFNDLLHAAAMVRKDILTNNKWSFSGNYEGFEIPVTLQSLLKWIIIFPKENIDMAPKKKDAIDTTEKILVRSL